MSIIESAAKPRSKEFKQNAADMQALVDDLQDKVRIVKDGGGEDSRERHLSRGKLLPRDRVRSLLDPGSPFLELSPMAAHEVYDDVVPGAGIITGVCLLYTSPSPRDLSTSRMPSSA